MNIHWTFTYANLQDATLYSEKVTREEVQLFNQPSYKFESKYNAYKLAFNNVEIIITKEVINHDVIFQYRLGKIDARHLC